MFQKSICKLPLPHINFSELLNQDFVIFGGTSLIGSSVGVVLNHFFASVGMWRACKIKGKRHAGKLRAPEVEEGNKYTSDYGFFYNFFVMTGWFAPAARQVFHHPPPPQTPFQMRSDPGLGPTWCPPCFLVNDIFPFCDVLKPQVQVEHISWFHLLSLQTSDAL